MHSSVDQHRAEILDQFTRQAGLFSSVPAHSAEDSLQLLADTIRIEPLDNVLDVACGPGIVSCWLAKKAKQVTGVDLVPAMIDQARKRQIGAALDNVEWEIADAGALPFVDATFSIVVTRYSFHHLLDPRKALREMTRVCRPGGRVVVADVTPEEGKTDAYDRLEKLRDPSHVHALSPVGLLSLGLGEQLSFSSTAAYRLEIPLDAQLNASFPPPENVRMIRDIVRQDIGLDRLSVDASERDGEVILRVPVSIIVWTKQQSLF